MNLVKPLLLSHFWYIYHDGTNPKRICHLLLGTLGSRHSLPMTLGLYGLLSSH